MKHVKPTSLLILLAAVMLLAACKPVTRPSEAAGSLPVLGEPVELRAGAGPFSDYREGTTSASEPARFRIALQENEYLQVYAGSAVGADTMPGNVPGNVGIEMWMPDGQMLPNASVGMGATGWAGVAPAAGDYRIEVVTNAEAVEYTLSVRVSPVSYEPLAEDECQSVEEAVEAALGLTTEHAPATFYDGRNDLGGNGCRIFFVESGTPFTDSAEVFEKIAAALPDWQENPDYQASGSTGVATGLVRGDALMLVSVLWEPTSDAHCPNDEPISNCELSPEQKVFVIQLDAAQRIGQK